MNEPGFVTVRLRVTPHMCPQLYNLLQGLPPAARAETIRVHMESALRGTGMPSAAAVPAGQQQVRAVEAPVPLNSSTSSESLDSADDLAGSLFS